MDSRSNNNVTFCCSYYCVWCSKYRRKVLVGQVESDLKKIVADVCKETRADLIKFEVMPEHVCLSVSVDPQFGIHNLVRRIKGTSSNILRKNHKHLKTKIPTLWTNSYFVATTGEVVPDKVKAHIENQRTSQRQGWKQG